MKLIDAFHSQKKIKDEYCFRLVFLLLTASCIQLPRQSFSSKEEHMRGYLPFQETLMDPKFHLGCHL